MGMAKRELARFARAIVIAMERQRVLPAQRSFRAEPPDRSPKTRYRQQIVERVAHLAGELIGDIGVIDADRLMLGRVAQRIRQERERIAHADRRFYVCKGLQRCFETLKPMSVLRED